MSDDAFRRLGAIRFEARIKALNKHGDNCVDHVQLSKKDKDADPRRQRKTKRWKNEDW